VHANGYTGFDEIYRSGDIREVACMAHIRRKFVEIHRAEGTSQLKPQLPECPAKQGQRSGSQLKVARTSAQFHPVLTRIMLLHLVRLPVGLPSLLLVFPLRSGPP
jgi:hypothetical protein